MYRKLVLATLWLILVTLALGFYVRAIGAGLACPEVPLCYGYLWPPAERAGHEPLQAWIQMEHRIAAAVLGMVLLALAGLAWRQLNRQVALLGSLGLLGLYGLQAGLGTLVVITHLWPAAVTAHLLLAALMAAVALFWYLSLKAVDWKILDTTVWLRRYARFAWWITLGQVVLGGWVSANFAGLACPDFPTCQGAWWPPLDWRAFAFWKHWGSGPAAWALLGAQAQITIHWLHRVGAAISFAVLFGLGISISSNPKVPHLSKLGVLLNFLLLVEIALGMGTLRYSLPVLAMAHGLGGIILLLTASVIEFSLQRAPSRSAVSIQLPDEVALPLPSKPVAWFERLETQLEKTRRGLTGFLTNLAVSGRELDAALVEEIETHLLMADVGVTATRQIIDDLTKKLGRHQLRGSSEVVQVLRDALLETLMPCSEPLRIDAEHKPFVILVVGVNGVGKTTTIGKLAQRFKHQGHNVMLAAGDTFRAAAVDQLKVWGERNGVPVVAQHPGADSASVIYDALQSAKARGIDVLIADTAGRLHTKSNLMEELAKIKRIMAKLDPTAPHEVLLVLDATTGQNALAQAEQFNQAVGVSGLVLTKLDGTAKGGVIFALAKKFGIPIRFIGIGEGIDDLQVFDAKAFVDALFAELVLGQRHVVVPGWN